MVTDDEVFVIDHVNNWLSARDKVLLLAACLEKRPSLFLKGKISAEKVDEIDQKTWNSDQITVHFTQYCTISDLIAIFDISEKQAKKIATTICKKYNLENERSLEIFNYINEIWRIIESNGDYRLND